MDVLHVTPLYRPYTSLAAKPSLVRPPDKYEQYQICEWAAFMLETLLTFHTGPLTARLYWHGDHEAFSFVNGKTTDLVRQFRIV